MRVQQKDKNIYTKGLDEIESYLVNIIRRFFETDQEEIWINREEIIIEAVKRAKEEILNNITYGVVSVNGKTGEVTLTHGDVNAEPIILKKNTAFNKNFGNRRGTVCEGDDPRLTDARPPLEHEHDSEYIKKTDVHLYIEEWLKEKGITFSAGKVKINDKNLEIINGEVEEK